MLKKELGQFFTTNYQYILQQLYIPDNIDHIIEPFCGQGDLINFIKDKDRYSIECYDIESRKEYIIQRDTLMNPPSYKNKFVITNPPYLARNKTIEKNSFDKYNTNDLYKCFLKELLTNQVLGGIVIIPLNFWSSIRKADIELRRDFLNIYNVLHLNIFEEQVFEDTSYTICSFQFELKENNLPNTIDITIYPSKRNINILLNEGNNYMIGGEIYNLHTNDTYTITRLTGKNKGLSNTNIVAKCIDDNINSKICLFYSDDIIKYIDNTPNQTARTYATLVIDPVLNEEKQKELIVKFNSYLEASREKYHSLFLTNYRESKDIARKRISFDLVYKIIKHILENEYRICLIHSDFNNSY